MADDLMTVWIVFKDPPREATYLIASAELERLTKDFSQNSTSGGRMSGGSTSYGVYKVQTDSGDPRRLAVRFADILFIG